ncbi:armadillo repeat-containing protein 3 isoform X3 [Lepisosteus oculatus]|uniref:armadillo repeat-containing protein 3 isoform X3 n=1 Tax=Lepisosteus oculatus TaxID=7918 RepID=UPI003719C659
MMGKKVKKEEEPPAKDVFDPLPIESKSAATVVLMLSSPEEEVLAKACEAIHRYAEKGDENKGTLVGLGAVEPLARLISHEDKVVRRNAIMALGVMAAHSDVKRHLKKLDIIPSVIGRLLPEEDVVIHEFASLCLAYLSVDYTSKVQIFDHDGLDPLIHLLSSPDPDVKKNAVECIYNLVQDFPSRSAVRELNGIPPLLELLKSEFPIIQQLTLTTLALITNDGENRVALRENQGLERLLEFLGAKEFSDLHVEALQVISNCLEDKEAMHLIQETGGLDKLLQFAETATLPEVQMNATKAISRAAQDSENRKILHEHDVEKTLVSLLAVDHDGVRIAACLAIAVMCDLLASKDSFRNHGVRPVVQLLSSENGEVKEAAALALSKLTQSNQLNAYAVFEAEGEEPLVQQLSDARDGAVAYAAAVLTNMAAQETLRPGILAHGVTPALAEALQSGNSLVLGNAALAVAALACDSEGRAELRNAGGLVPLVKLLNSNNTEVRRNACWAALVCANDEPTAVELCKLGALEILQDINLSSNRRNKFSEAALLKLLDSNLSIKYSLTGYLSPTDLITDGFYDPGQVKPGHRILTLEDLSKQEVNQHRPVILVDGKPHEQVSTESAPIDEKQQDGLGATRSPSVLSKSSTKEKTPSKGKNKGKKDDEKQKDEDEIKSPQETITENKPGIPSSDSAFHALVSEAAKAVLPLHDTREQVIGLAKLVADAMGGDVERDKLHEFSWELHLSELKYELKSNIVPIGKIKKGIFYHRALLFKALADRIGINCSLVRGDYNRAWNEVAIVEGSPKVPGPRLQPKTYIVDLIHRPGRLMKNSSPEAIQYQTI